MFTKKRRGWSRVAVASLVFALASGGMQLTSFADEETPAEVAVEQVQENTEEETTSEEEEAAPVEEETAPEEEEVEAPEEEAVSEEEEALEEEEASEEEELETVAAAATVLKASPAKAPKATNSTGTSVTEWNLTGSNVKEAKVGETATPWNVTAVEDTFEVTEQYWRENGSKDPFTGVFQEGTKYHYYIKLVAKDGYDWNYMIKTGVSDFDYLAEYVIVNGNLSPKEFGFHIEQYFPEAGKNDIIELYITSMRQIDRPATGGDEEKKDDDKKEDDQQGEDETKQTPAPNEEKEQPVEERENFVGEQESPENEAPAAENNGGGNQTTAQPAAQEVSAPAEVLGAVREEATVAATVGEAPAMTAEEEAVVLGARRGATTGDFGMVLPGVFALMSAVSGIAAAFTGHKKR